MRKTKFLLALLCLLTTTAISWAAETRTPVCSITTVVANQGCNTNQYTDACSLKSGSLEWTTQNFSTNNNSTSWNCIKCGRKSNTTVAYVETDFTIAAAVDKVSIKFDYTVTSKTATINLYSSSDGVNWNKVYNSDYSTKANDVVLDMEINSPVANQYYKVEFDCPIMGSNGAIALYSIDYYAVEEKQPERVKADFYVKNADEFQNMKVGESKVLDFSISPALLADFMLDSDDSAVVTVDDETYTVTAIAAGNTNLTFVWGDSEEYVEGAYFLEGEASMPVSVIEEGALLMPTFKASREGETLYVGDYVEIVDNNEGTTLQFSDLSEEFVKGEDGKYYAVKASDAADIVVSAKNAEGKESAEAEGMWEICQRVAAIDLGEAVKMAPGEEKALTAKLTLTPADSKTPAIVWTSSNPDVVAVDAKGNLTAGVVGDATITATLVQDTEFTGMWAAASATVDVNVAEAPLVVAFVVGTYDYQGQGEKVKMENGTSGKIANVKFDSACCSLENTSTANSSNETYVDGALIRWYGGDVFTITPNANCAINKIVIHTSASSYTKAVTASAGTSSFDANAQTITWTAPKDTKQTTAFTLKSSAQIRFNYIEVEYVKLAVDAAVAPEVSNSRGAETQLYVGDKLTMSTKTEGGVVEYFLGDDVFDNEEIENWTVYTAPIVLDKAQDELYVYARTAKDGKYAYLDEPMTYSVSLPTATVKFNKENFEIGEGTSDFIKATVTVEPSDIAAPELIWTVDNDDEAISFDKETGEIKGLKAGEAMISVSFDKAKYLGEDAIATIEVNEFEQPLTVTFDGDWYTRAGLSSGQQITKATTIVEDGVIIDFKEKPSTLTTNDSWTGLYATLRFYKTAADHDVFTVTAPEGYRVVGVDITTTTNNGTVYGFLKEGDYVLTENKWTGKKDAVTFTACNTATVYISDITVTLAKKSDVPENPELTVVNSADLAEMSEGSSAAVVFSPEGLTISASGNDETIAKYVDGKIVAVAPGETTFTFTSAATDEYTEGSCTLEVKVVEYVAPTTVTFSFDGTVKDYYDLPTNPAGNTWTDETTVYGKTAESNGVKVTFNKNSASTRGGINSKSGAEQLRLYPNSSVTFAAPNGYVITGVTITAISTSNTGTWSEVNKLGNVSGLSWTGRSNTVELKNTASTGNAQLKSFTVTLAKANPHLAISGEGVYQSEVDNNYYATVAKGETVKVVPVEVSDDIQGFNYVRKNLKTGVVETEMPLVNDTIQLDVVGNFEYTFNAVNNDEETFLTTTLFVIVKDGDVKDSETHDFKFHESSYDIRHDGEWLKDNSTINAGNGVDFFIAQGQNFFKYVEDAAYNYLHMEKGAVLNISLDHFGRKFTSITVDGQNIENLVLEAADGYTLNLRTGENHVFDADKNIRDFVIRHAGAASAQQSLRRRVIAADSDAVALKSISLSSDVSTGVDAINAVDGAEEVYDLNGLRVDRDNLAPGMYIVRRAGVVSKILVK